MRRKKQKKMGVLALSVLLASSLSAPTTAMAAETTTLETNQTEAQAETGIVSAEPASNEQPAESASSEQTAAPASSEQTAAPASSEQTAISVDASASEHQQTDVSVENAGADNTQPNAGVDSKSEISSNPETVGENAISREPSQEPAAVPLGVQQAPQQDEKTGFEESPVDKKTTAKNNVTEAVPSDDKQGSDISYNYEGHISFLGFEYSFNGKKNATITPEDANSDKTLRDVSEDFKGTDFGKEKASDLVVKGDMSIEGDKSIKGDTTKDAAHDVEKDSKHDVRADLDVSAIHTSIEKSGSMLYGGANAAKAVYVNHLETGLRSTFTFENGLNGEFYVPTSLKDAQAHYILSSADGTPLIYRINYANSKFKNDKVTIFMDLDLTHMDEKKTTYKNSDKKLYGENGVMENFNHDDTETEHDSTYDTSNFGNLQQLITSSAKKISLLLKDVLFHSATGNSTTTETDTETKTTTQGSIKGTLVGYMKADVGYSTVKGKVSYVWGAMQDAEGRDVNAADDRVMLTTQFTETTPKNNPSIPDTPSNPATPGTPEAPSTPDTPSTPETPSTPNTAGTERSSGKSGNSGSSRSSGRSNTSNMASVPDSLDTSNSPDTPNTLNMSSVPGSLDTSSDPNVHASSVTHGKDNQAMSAVTTSKTVKSPQTGDASHPYVWFLSMIVSAGMCGESILHLKKKNNR